MLSHCRATRSAPTAVLLGVLPLASARAQGVAEEAERWGVVAALVLLLIIAAVVILALWAKLRRQKRRFRANEARLSTILDSVDTYIYIKDTRLRYRYGNRQICERFRRTPRTLIGATDAEFLPNEALAKVRAADLRVLEDGKRIVIEEELPRPEGIGSDFYLSIKFPLRAPDGSIEAVCGFSTDITELRANREAIQHLAYYDALTDLPNRRMLQERIEEAMHCRKAGGPVAGIVFIDLDKFKNINDERGHDVGDAVLCAIARRLVGIVGKAGIVARLGGDEFVILLHDLGTTSEAAAAQARTLAETVRRSLTNAITVGDQSYFTGGSIGVTLIDDHTRSVADVLREADTAMYRSKEAGRNRVAFYEPAMHEQVTQRAALLRDLVKVLDTGQFQLLVQPQYDAQGTVVGAELLLRWDHPTHGTIMPDAFIGLVEEAGVMDKVGEWTLRQACALHARLAEAGAEHPISINVSPTQLRHADFHERVIDILRETGTPASHILLELTESVLIDDVDDAARRMRALAEAGVRFSIDDFGTGYSGLAYLRRLPLYELKIAGSFVHDLPDNDAGTLIRLIIAAARLLELRVVAEGVENERQAQFLIGVGCDILQGYLYHHPTPIEAWIEERAGKPMPPAKAQCQEAS